VTTDYQLGDRVTFTRSLTRRSHSDETWWHLRSWTTEGYPGQPEPEPRLGIVIGVRNLANGRVLCGYEEPTEFHPTEHFRAYLIAYDLRRSPVYVLPEHITPEETR